MQFGLFGINIGPGSQPETLIKIAQAAEAAGFDSVWTGEHVVLPDPAIPSSPMEPEVPLLDPTVAFSFIASHTKQLRLGTGIIILPQRNPLVLAKELASLDVLSGGRLIFGIGIGYLKPEFDALGIPFEEKGRRTIEYLEAMCAIWSQAQPAYQGKFVSFRGVQSLPRPVQQPSPPIVFGGMTPYAFRRAVSHGHGWYGFALDLEGTKRCVDGLREALQKTTRPAELGELEISVTPTGTLDRDTIERYADLGVQRLILPPRQNPEAATNYLHLTEADVLAFVERVHDTLM